jgi:AcrR family transcriptional regulator
MILSSPMRPPEPTLQLDPHLIDAAANVLDAAGAVGLTLSAIAEAAGVSRVTVHRRGATVDDYIVAVLARASDDLRSSLWPMLTSSEPASERLRSALTILCEVCERHTGIMTAMFGVPPRDLPGRPGRTTSLEFIEPFAKLLGDGQTDGSLTAGDPMPDATLLANCVAWTYLHMRRAHRWDPAVTAERTVTMAIASFLTR